MSRKRMSYEQIGEIIEKINEAGLSYQEGAKEFDLPVQSLYTYNHWKKRQGDKPAVNQEGETAAGNEEIQCVPESSAAEVPAAVPPEIQQLILDYRNEHPDHGFKRIEDYLKSHHFLAIPRKNIRAVLKAHDVLETVDSSFDKGAVQTAKGTRRFEANYPRELYQMDVTYVYLAGMAVLYLVMIIDDFSRFCVCSALRGDQKGLTMIEVVHQTIERYGKPKRLLTDQGSSFYSWGQNPTLFQQYLDDMKIEHVVADPHSPQTLGKVERLNKTIKLELLEKRRFSGLEEASAGIEAYFQGYNYERCHQGIGGKRPADRFHGVIAETTQIERELMSQELDFSRGYLVLRTGGHNVSLVSGVRGLQVFVDGNEWKGV